jgi:hypothetical protein
MIEVIQEGMRGNVVALAASGKVSHEDYRAVVIPVVEEKVKAYDKVRLLYRLGEDFTGFTPGALWDDTQIGLRHLTAFDKIAVVTDHGWIREALRVFRVFVPCPVRIFSNAQGAEASAWIND